MTMKDQRDLLLAVGGMLTNAEDPKHVKSAVAKCGKAQLENVGRVWNRVWRNVHKRHKLQSSKKG